VRASALKKLFTVVLEYGIPYTASPARADITVWNGTGGTNFNSAGNWSAGDPADVRTTFRPRDLTFLRTVRYGSVGATSMVLNVGTPAPELRGEFLYQLPKALIYGCDVTLVLIGADKNLSTAAPRHWDRGESHGGVSQH
jgi:hypothetical protein